MPNAILVHGMPDRDEYYAPSQPSASNAHWFPWLQNQLLIAGIAAATPEMPLAYAPDYPVWAREFERFDVRPDTILVGHSCGGGFLVRWLSEHPDVHVARVVLVAPWLDPEGKTAGFFDFDLDPDLTSRAELSVWHSTDDMDSVTRSVALLRKQLPTMAYREFTGYGHFCTGDLGAAEFPELLKHLLA